MSTIYFSRFSPDASEFFKKLKSENMHKMFDQYFCLDNRDPREIPHWLKNQKLVIVVPEHDKPLYNKDVFTWLNYKLNQKYKQQELGTLNQDDGNYVSLNKDPNDITLDTGDYISINNIDKPLKPESQSATRQFNQAESMDVSQRLEALQQERANFMQAQKGQPPQQTPNFQR